jgi:hypothetical protein
MENEMSAYTLFGKTTWCYSDKEVYLGVIRALSLRHKNFYSELQKRVKTRKRLFFAPGRIALFPGSPWLADADSHVTKFAEYWYADTNLSNRKKEQIIIQACLVVGIRYYDDLEIRFDGGKYCPQSKGQAKAELEQLMAELDQLLIVDVH